ncbi:MAG: DUF2752 domain-containing protein [Bacilli bacterium]|nr:DUF2752 domain-containing protein [Bacilli bacterium]
MIKRIFHLLLPFIIILGLFLISKYLGYQCIFRKYLHIHCAGCGLTRSFNALFHGNISDCLYYNVLTFPIIGMVIFYEVLAVKDIIKKQNKLFDTYFGFIVNHIIFFAGIIIVSMIYANVCNI